MSSLSGEKITKSAFKFFWQPDTWFSSLIVCWDADISHLGARVSAYLIKNLSGQAFCEIELMEFFSWGGVAISGNLIQIPQSKFYACSKADLSILYSSVPVYDKFKFLNTVLDAAEHCLHVKEIYGIGEMTSMAPHTSPRSLIGVFDSEGSKRQFEHYDLEVNFNYESPFGQWPAFSSYLLQWVAKRRNIPLIILWVPIPFYLLSLRDPGAEKRVLDFFNQRFELGLEFSELDQDIKRQNEAIARARFNSPDIDQTLKKLEAQIRTSEEENQALVAQLRGYLE